MGPALALLLGLALCAPVRAATLPGPRPVNSALGSGSPAEVKLQISLSLWAAATVTRASGLYGAYEQSSLWSLVETGRPYRLENDFRPEFGGVMGPDLAQHLVPAWPAWLTLGAGYIHESNGLQGDPSRSWNRATVVAHVAPAQAPLRGSLSLWHAFRVEETTQGITDHAGVGELRVDWELPGWLRGSRLRLASAFSPAAPGFFTNLQLAALLWPRFLPRWIAPDDDGPSVDFMAEWFVGSGEFLYDFSEETNQLRLGIALRP